MKLPHLTPLSAQRGSVLVISLIILLLLTMLGLSNMRTTTVEERMASNLRDHNLAFQAAESALRAGEQFVQTGSNRPGLRSAAQLADPASWNGVNPAPTGTHNLNAGLAIPHAANPVFHVGPASVVRVGVSSSELKYYCTHRVTARGVGLTDSAVSILQSTIGFYESADGDC